MAAPPKTVMIEVKVPEPRALRLDARRCALVIVDMQNDYCKPEGKLNLSPRRSGVVEPIRKLLGRCRQAGVQVIYVQSLREPDSPEFSVFGLEPYVLRGSWGSRIAEELTPLPGEPVVEKDSHDPFNNTRMERLLAERSITAPDWTIVVVGLGLTNCVSCAVTGFSVRNYRVALPMDCTASATREEELCQYQRFMQLGYSYNVTLTESPLIELS